MPRSQFRNSKFSFLYSAHMIFSNKMEVQVDVSASETASAVTCVSEKSNNDNGSTTASTRALAGSTYKQVGSMLPKEKAMKYQQQQG